MEYSKFSLGLRFAMTSDSNLTPADCWNITFSEVPITHTVGTTLFGAWDDVGAAESESAYICMFSNLPLKVGKALFAQLQHAVLVRERRFIWTLAPQCVINITDGDDLRGERNFVSL